MTRLVIGLGIATNTVRAIGVEGTTVRWAVEAERAEDEPLSAALAVLLARCPRPWWPRPHVIVAVGPAAVRVKRVAGLPPISDPTVLAAVVRESAHRFFIHAGVPLVTTGLRMIEPGAGWAAAFEAPVAAEVQRACSIARLRLRMIIPTVVALGYAVDDEQVVWCDGVVRTVVTFARASVDAVRRVPENASTPVPHATPVSALAALGDRALGFADAYGATQVPRHEALSLRAHGPNRGTSSRRGLVAAAGALVLMAVVALTAPGLASMYAAHRASVRLAALKARDHDARAAERELGRVTTGLSEIATFEASRHATTLLLGNLTHALPAKSVLIALQLDSVTGTLIALTPRAALVTDALEHTMGISSPEIVGPVTREMVPGRGELEHVTVRFRLWRGAPARTISRVRSSTAGVGP